jgi:hypothetical protein
MRILDRRRVVISIVAAACISLFWPGTAHARRLVEFEILLDGKLILRAHWGDEGEGPDIVWGYLKTLKFKLPEKEYIREKERPAKDFTVAPDKNDPLRATLKGKIRIFARYGGDVTVNTLELVRDKKDSQEWRLSAKEVERTKKLRKVDPRSKVRD